MARIGTTTMRDRGHNWDNEAGCVYANTSPKEHVWPNSCDCKDGYKDTSPVGSYKGNAFGLDDNCGYVWEWVVDFLEDNYRGALRRQRLDCQ